MESFENRPESKKDTTITIDRSKPFVPESGSSEKVLEEGNGERLVELDLSTVRLSTDDGVTRMYTDRGEEIFADAQLCYAIFDNQDKIPENWKKALENEDGILFAGTLLEYDGDNDCYYKLNFHKEQNLEGSWEIDIRSLKDI